LIHSEPKGAHTMERVQFDIYADYA
jgi:hypothetical protein